MPPVAGGGIHNHEGPNPRCFLLSFGPTDPNSPRGFVIYNNHDEHGGGSVRVAGERLRQTDDTPGKGWSIHIVYKKSAIRECLGGER